MNHISFFWAHEHQELIYQTIKNEFCEQLKLSIENGKFILPPIPSAVLEIQQLCSTSETTINDVADCLLNDPGLTATVLRIANNVFFNRRGIMFTDVHSAISRLGIFRVRDIVTAQSIEQLKYAINLNAECTQILRHSAAHSRELSATMVVVVDALKKMSPEKYAYLETDKALLVGLLADIGLFCLMSEYHLYLEHGNYIDKDIALRVFESVCPRASKRVLTEWGFDSDYVSVAENKETVPKMHDVSYLDIAKIAYYVLLYFQQEAELEEYEIEINADSAEVICDLTNMSPLEFDTLIHQVINSSGF